MTMPFDAYTDVPDEALLKLFANGDRVAAKVLTLRLTPRVYRQAYRILKDQAEAEDIAQEAMLRLWKTAPDWRQDQAKITTWLYQVTANLCTDRLRRRKPADALDAVPEPEDAADSADIQMQNRTRAEALNAALQALPDRQREAVTLRHLEEFTNPQIAEAMGVGIEAVESLVARGKRALKGLLAKRKEELGYDDWRR
jgi:RNA polymerase sigma-70 factor (ECF subfamily)